MSDDRLIEAPPAGVAGWREVWTRRLRYRSGAIFEPIRRLARKLIAPDLDLQRDFNLATIELLDGLKGDILALRQELGSMRALEDEKIVAGIKRNDALITVLDQKIEGSLARIRDLATPVLTSPDAGSFRDDYLYRRFEEAARGSKDEIRESMRSLMDLLKDHGPVLDVGCGRGELLELCREERIACRGIDLNERSVAELKAAGHEVDIGSVPGYLDRLEPASIGAVFASHVVEHLPTSPLVALFTASHRVLRKGGLLIIETPNAQSLMMSGSEFWKDPSHLAPRHPASLVIIARELGFRVEELRTLHPFDESAKLHLEGTHPADLQRLVDRLNEILFGDQDLRLILRK